MIKEPEQHVNNTHEVVHEQVDKVLVVAPENDEVRSKHVQKMLEDRSEVVCMLCTYKIQKDDSIFDDVPLIAVDENEDCRTLNILHTRCLQRGIDSAKTDLSNVVLYKDWENVWLDKSIEEHMHGFKCLPCREPVSDIFTLLSKKEQTKKISKSTNIT